MFSYGDSMIAAPAVESTACDRLTERCSDAKKYRASTPDCCRGHVRDIFAAVNEAFREHGVTWWMDYGTLLGAVRNPLMGQPAGLLSHDKDGDAGFLGSDWGKVRAALGIDGKSGRSYDVRRGENVHYRWRDLLVIHKLGRVKMVTGFEAGDSIKVCLSEKNRTNVDLFPWYEDGGGQMFRQCYVSVDQYKGRDFPKDKAFPLTELPYEDLTLPAPHDPQTFLSHRYGVRWKTPIEKNNDARRRPDGWQGV